MTYEIIICSSPGIHINCPVDYPTHRIPVKERQTASHF